jgi:PHD/YefM family antitoxin component YafN of YafNO toxin-antitoxin module
MFKKPIIKPSTDIRKDYGSISKLAKESGSPVFITKNGTGDTVIMDMETYSKREIALDQRQEKLEDAERAFRAKMRFMNGERGIPVEESRKQALAVIDEIARRQGETG